MARGLEQLRCCDHAASADARNRSRPKYSARSDTPQRCPDGVLAGDVPALRFRISIRWTGRGNWVAWLRVAGAAETLFVPRSEFGATAPLFLRFCLALCPDRL